MPETHSCCCCGRESPADGDNRRGFFARAAAVVFGGIAVAIPGAAGIAAFLNPLRQKGQGGQLMRLASLDVLPDDGTPVKMPIIAQRADAWTQYPPSPIGAVFLRREGKKVLALQSLCPHAACPLGYDAQNKQFACPCHAQPRFRLSGERVEGPKSYSPRDMDSLDVEIRNKNEIWVKFETFRVGTSEKIAQA
jgi:menaquinol-cytochrome c reductase iron-sulfur subunit